MGDTSIIRQAANGAWRTGDLDQLGDFGVQIGQGLSQELLVPGILGCLELLEHMLAG